MTGGSAEKRVLYGRVSDNDAYREKHVFGINGGENARRSGIFQGVTRESLFSDEVAAVFVNILNVTLTF